MSASLAVALTGWGSSAGLALALARRRAKEIARGDRLAGVVHELRGPLQAAGLIVTAARRSTGAEGQRALEALEVELGRLTLAVGDLRPDRRSAQPVVLPAPRCDVAALVGELAPGWRLLASESGRDVRVTAPGGALWVAAERLRLAQALGNLIANALEHGGGDVEVVLGATANGELRIEVCDGGPGLPANVASLVRRRADPSRARGRGLGIAARIVADAGGRLWSAPAGGGARLVLQLPTSTSVPAPTVVAGSRARALPTRPLAS